MLTQDRILCFVAFLIVIVRVNIPQITLPAQNLIRTQKPHKNAVVLIVILKAPITPDEIQIFKAIKGFVDFMQVIFVAPLIHRIAFVDFKLVLIVILKAPITPDEIQIFKAIKGFVDFMQVIFVAPLIHRIAFVDFKHTGVFDKPRVCYKLRF